MGGTIRRRGLLLRQSPVRAGESDHCYHRHRDCVRASHRLGVRQSAVGEAKNRGIELSKPNFVVVESPDWFPCVQAGAQKKANSRIRVVAKWTISLAANCNSLKS